MSSDDSLDVPIIEEPVNDEVEVSFANSFAILSELLFEGKLQPKQAERYKLKLTRLQQGVLKANQIDSRLQQYSKKLKDELDNLKETLKKSGSLSFEDNTTIGNLKRDLIKAQNEAAMCNEREELEKLEEDQLVSRKNALNEDYEYTRKKKEEELEPKLQALKITTEDMKTEMQHQKALLSRMYGEYKELAEKIESNTNDKHLLDQEVAGLKHGLNKIKGDPEKYRKQADVVQVAAKNMTDESVSLLADADDKDRHLSLISKKKKEIMDESMDLAVQLDRHRNAIEQKERQGDQILKELELQKEETMNYMAIRAASDMNVRGKEFHIRRKEELMVMKQREINVAMKQLRKAKFQLEFVQKSVPELQHILSETQRELEAQKFGSRRQKEVLEDMKVEMDIVMNSFLMQEDVEKETAEQLAAMMREINHLEEDLDRWATQEQKLNREIASLSIEREARAHEAAKAITQLRDIKEDLKMKELIIYDYTKQAHETETRLQQYETIYEHVKNERNKYMNLIQTIRLTDSELKEKIKILQNEIDILRTETLTKNKALMKVRAEFQALCNERDQYRNEINKSTYHEKTKHEMIDQQSVELQKLSAIIIATEHEMRVLKKKYEAGVEDRNFTGLQLIDRNDELCILYEKSNIQESIIRNGDIELRKKEEELRILRLHQSEVQRELDVTRRLMPNIPQLEGEIKDLSISLNSERDEAAELVLQLEDPENTERYRKLEGYDPTLEELQLKYSKIQKRVAAREEKIKEKQQVLQEITTLVERLQKQIEDSRIDTLNTAKQMNELKASIKATNRKLMSTVSQLSVYKGTSIQLNKQNEDLTQLVDLANRNLSRGMAPVPEAEDEWYKMELRRMREQRERESTPPAPRVTTDGRFTTASRRADHYIPEGGFGLPRPYGGTAPFVPTEQGASMRHIRKPRPKEIDLLGT